MSFDAGPLLPADDVPWVSVGQMREVNRVMTGELGISLVRMMENAGRSLAVVARGMLGDARGRRIVLLVGGGGNGGGGMVAARHLANAGAEIDVRLAIPALRIDGVPGAQLAILTAMGIEARCAPATPIGRPDLVIDALLGYGQRGAPHGEAARLIAATGGLRVLSLDIPTGVDPDTGEASPPAIRAEITLTLAAPKTGLGAPAARTHVGRLLLADISVPAQVLARVGATPGCPFARSPIVEITPPPAA